MSNNIGRLGADAIQRMQQAQQANAPQVEGQNEETSQTVRKPLSKSESVGMMKGNVGEPTNNVNTDIVATQEAQAGEHNDNEPDKNYTIYVTDNGDGTYTYHHSKDGTQKIVILSHGNIDHTLTNPETYERWANLIAENGTDGTWTTTTVIGLGGG